MSYPWPIWSGEHSNGSGGGPRFLVWPMREKICEWTNGSYLKNTSFQCIKGKTMSSDFYCILPQRRKVEVRCHLLVLAHIPITGQWHYFFKVWFLSCHDISRCFHQIRWKGLLTKYFWWMLIVDSVGGLQVKSQDQWIDAQVIPGTILYFIPPNLASHCTLILHSPSHFHSFQFLWSLVSATSHL